MLLSPSSALFCFSGKGMQIKWVIRQSIFATKRGRQVRDMIQLSAPKRGSHSFQHQGGKFLPNELMGPTNAWGWIGGETRRRWSAQGVGTGSLQHLASPTTIHVTCGTRDLTPYSSVTSDGAPTYDIPKKKVCTLASRRWDGNTHTHTCHVSAKLEACEETTATIAQDSKILPLLPQATYI